MKTLRGFITILSITLAVAVAASAQINLTAIDGSRVNIEGQHGKVVILAIGASWLPLSEKQAEFTTELAKKFAGRDVVVYFVATDSVNQRSKNYASDAKIRAFAVANKLGVMVLRDSDGGATIRKFKVEQMPSFVILDKNSVQAGEPFGGIDPKFDITVPIAKAVNKLL
jgi:thiol-disulfide isomerase/thioredoxin